MLAVSRASTDAPEGQGWRWAWSRLMRMDESLSMGSPSLTVVLEQHCELS